MFQTANLRIFFGIHADVDKKKSDHTFDHDCIYRKLAYNDFFLQKDS